jgi:hypothetical protein
VLNKKRKVCKKMEAQLITQPSSKKEYPIRYVGVVFGNPRSPECAGYGICKMDDDGTEPPQKKREIQAICPRYSVAIEKKELKKEKNYLVFNFLKSELNTEIIDMYFNDTYFRIINEILLPITLTHAFEMPPSVLKAGLYKIIEKKECLQIQIQVAQLLNL